MRNIYIKKFYIEPFDFSFVLDFRKSINNDKNFLEKYKKLISGLDDESINVVFDIIMNKIYNYKNIDDPIYFNDLELQYLEKVYSKFKIYKN